MLVLIFLSFALTHMSNVLFVLQKKLLLRHLHELL